MSLARRAMTGTMLLVGSTMASQAIGLVEVVALARLLDPGAFGTYALARFFFDILQRVRQLWVGYFLIRDEHVSERSLATLLGVQVLISGALVLLAALGAPLVRGFHGALLATVFLAIAAAAVFDDMGLGSIPLALLERDLRYREIVSVALAGRALGMGAAVLSAWQGWGVWALVAEQAVIGLITFAGYSACVGSRMSSAWRGLWRLFDAKDARRLLRTEGSYLWVLGVGWWLTNSLGDFLVGSQVGLVALGHFTRAYTLSSLQVGLLGALSRAMLPVYSRLREETDRVATAYRLTMGLIIRMSTLAGVILFVAADPIVAVVLGRGWMPVVALVQAFLVFQVARPVMEALGSLLMALGRLRGYALVSAGAGGIMLAAGWLATVQFGAAGAAAVLGLSTAGAATALHHQLPAEVRRASSEIFSSPLLIGAGAIALSLGLGTLWPWGGSSWPAAVARVAVPIGGYCLVLLLTERRALGLAIGFVRERLASGEA